MRSLNLYQIYALILSIILGLCVFCLTYYTLGLLLHPIKKIIEKKILNEVNIYVFFNY